MKFSNSKLLKPIVSGFIQGKAAHMLLDTGADYVILTVPKYRIKRDSNGQASVDNHGQFVRERIYLDAEYDKMIRETYGSLLTDQSGNYIKTTVHGFGNTTAECRLMVLNSFTLMGHEFTDSYVLLDEKGLGTNHDMILGTACLRNFLITLDYEEKNVELNPKNEILKVNYLGIISNDANMVGSGIVFPSDIYMQESFYDDYEIGL